MLTLPDITLVLIETREHDLARLALADCFGAAEFGETLIFTDKPERFGVVVGEHDKQRVRFIRVPDWPNKMGWSRCFWYEVPLHLRTTHALGIQWDSWIVDPEQWRDAYLDYDYVGAPWWYKDGLNVGNGGFCLRSAKLMRFVRRNRAQFPCITDLDDDLYCRKYRPTLQAAGFEWAPEALARDFAFETTRPDPSARHFGFHAAYNFDYGCQGDEARLLERAQLMARSDYICKSNSYIWQGFAKKYPDLAQTVERDNGRSIPRMP